MIGMKSLTNGVKPILGTGTWGPHGQTNAATALKQIKSVLKTLKKDEKLILDTARVYQGGQTEELIGQLLSENPDIRNRVEIHTKAHPMAGPLSKENITNMLDQSLNSLQMKSVDLYYLHSPDISIPIEETLETCNDLHQQGKFRLLGLSNYAAWDVVRIHMICKMNNWIIPSVYQGCYSVINRTVEPELLPALRALGMNFYAYKPIAAGLLSGRYKTVSDLENATEGRFSGDFQLAPEGTTIEGMKKLSGAAALIYRKNYGKDAYFKAIEAISQSIGDSPMSEVAFRWLKHHSWLRNGDGIVFGASKLQHAQSNAESLTKGELDKKTVNACNAAWIFAEEAAETYTRGYGPDPGNSESFLKQFDN